MTSDYEPTFACRQCLDVGWIALRCERDTRCARTKTHGPHTFAVRCPCWLKKHADAIRSNAEQARQKGQSVSRTFEDLAELMAGRYRWRNVVTIATEVQARRSDAA